MKKMMMKTSLLISFCLLALPAFAEEGAFSGEGSVGFRDVENGRESAKFQEYRDLNDGTFGDVDVRYRSKDYYFLDLRADKIGRDDQYLSLKGGRYGKYRIELIYDKIPHRFIFDAKTLYAGTGTGNLVLSDRLQQDLQDVSTDDVGDLDGNGTPNETADRNIALINRLNADFAGAFTTDVQLIRKTGKVNFDLMAFHPFNVRVEFKNEKRTGTRPFSGSFGFSNTLEIPEPINYDTNTVRLIAEYAEKPLYLSASYYVSLFENNNDTLTWDNPFRAVDSTSATAYAATYAAGPSKGLIDLAPDNWYHNVSIAAAMNLPLRSRISATASWGWLRQDDDLKPFTTNTAINAASTPAAPFGASDPANLPARKVDGRVDTTLYNVQLTSKPFSFLHAKAKYRYYEYDNDTKLIEFPGYVRADAQWVTAGTTTGTIENEPTGFKKHTAGVDLGFDVFRRSTLTLGYTFENTKREHREVASQDEHTYRATFDTKPLEWLDFRGAYEHAERDGDYDFRVPFETLTGNPPQLPFLRKYDEANRVRDKVKFAATFYPADVLTVTGSITYWTDDYRDSTFGLLDDEHQIYTIDADYTFKDRAFLYAFYSFERVENTQKARQWSPGGIGDPYSTETGLDSNSNWVADKRDKTHTVGGGLDCSVIRNALDFGINYSYSLTDGNINLTSPVGTSSDDANAFTPIGFKQVDDITTQTLNAKVRHHFNKSLALTLGYLWERFDVSDFSDAGFSFVPTTLTGAFNGAILMGFTPKSYDASVIYAKLTYKF